MNGRGTSVDNPSPLTIKLMRALARKAERDQSFVAYALRQYMEMERIGEEELRNRLRCSEHGFLRLSLCRRPQVDSAGFRRDVERCAEVSGSDGIALANLLRAVRYKELMAEPGIVAARMSEEAESGGACADRAASPGGGDQPGPDRPPQERPEPPEKREPEADATF